MSQHTAAAAAPTTPHVEHTSRAQRHATQRNPNPVVHNGGVLYDEPTGMRVSFEIITPEQAKRDLDAQPKQRNARADRIATYARDIVADQWYANGETVAYDTDGHLMNGQHRYRAIVAANKPLRLLVVRNVPRNVMATIDTGAPRMFRDVLAIEGSHYTTAVAAAARVWLKYDLGMMSSDRAKPSHSELAAVTHAHFDALLVGAKRATTNKQLRRLVPDSIATFAYAFVFERDPDAAELFFNELVAAEGMKKGTAMHSLYRALFNNATSRSKMPGRNLLALVIKGFNKWFAGEDAAVIAFHPAQEDFPQFTF